MKRRSTAACLAMLLLAVACSGTTVISEGTLGSGPADQSESSSSTSPAERDADSTESDGDQGDVLGVVSDEQIGALSADCEQGSDFACDILYQASALASPEEALARTCAGRQPSNTGFCTTGIRQADDGLWFDEASPGLGAVEDACLDGDLTACDFLYFRSPIGSLFEEMGTTCGGRVDVAIPDCRTSLADED